MFFFAVRGEIDIRIRQKRFFDSFVEIIYVYVAHSALHNTAKIKTQREIYLARAGR